MSAPIISKRAFLAGVAKSAGVVAAGAAASAIATGAMAAQAGVTDAELIAPEPVLDSWIPKGAIGCYWSHLDEDAAMPLSFCFTGGVFRKATEGELHHALLERPYQTSHVAPDVLRRVLPDHDGEFFALLVERRELTRSSYDPETRGYRPGYRKADDALLDRICPCPVVTDIGVAMRLEMIFDNLCRPQQNMTPARQRMLLQGALRWLHSRIMDEGGAMEARPVDVAAARATLLAMAARS